MLKQLKELYSLLTPEQRKKLLLLQILVVLMSFAEIASVVSIGPFMALVGDMGQLQGEGWIAEMYRASGLEEPRVFMFWIGISVLVVLTLAALISMYTVWRLSMYGTRVGAELASRLFRYYMHQPWLFHASGSSSRLTNLIAQETQRVTYTIINPFMMMNAKLAMAMLMVIAVFLYNPLVACTGFLIFVSAYLLLYWVVRRRLFRNGELMSSQQELRFKLMSEGFGGIKDVLLLGRQTIFTERFTATSSTIAKAQGTNQTLSLAPRYAMELVAFGCVILLVLYLVDQHEGNLGAILPVLSVYALAGFKMLPAFQQVYSSLSVIRGNMAAFEAVRTDLKASGNGSRSDSTCNQNKLSPKKEIQIKNVVFSYPGKQEPALDGVNITIPVNQVIGLVGASGSGKSTSIDLLLGLIEPQQGQMLVDGVPITDENRRAWQNSLGFVPQTIFLADCSIRENIAFGLPPKLIDDYQVKKAISMAHLDEFIAELPDGLETRVGERGVQLSGGQRQRIGIARALYHDADVLVLDEATSALDGITEKLIMDAIHDFSRMKTIIMIAHRLSTVKQCDSIIFMKQGRVEDQGTFKMLKDRNSDFREMAKNS